MPQANVSWIPDSTSKYFVDYGFYEQHFLDSGFLKQMFLGFLNSDYLTWSDLNNELECASNKEEVTIRVAFF